ncbi:MAG: exo-alpha-sialidase [Desulfamplus sp.]|nr:exo-alpha-sialidase [Desulfamplus sp.]
MSEEKKSVKNVNMKLNCNYLFLIIALLGISNELFGLQDFSKPAIYMINCGGNAVEGFSKDQPYINGSYGYFGKTESFNIERKLDYAYDHNQVMSSCRIAKEKIVSYKLDVKPGKYFVHLYFADPTASHLNENVMNVKIQDKLVLKDFDTYWATTWEINKDSTGYGTTVQGFLVEIKDNESINILIEAINGKAFINAIAVQEAYTDLFTPCAQGKGQSFEKWEEPNRRYIYSQNWDNNENKYLFLNENQKWHSQQLIIPERYVLQFKCKLIDEHSTGIIEVNDGYFALKLELNQNLQKAWQSDGMASQDNSGIKNIGDINVGNNWHLYTIMIHKGFAHLYIDSVNVAAFPIEVSTASDGITCSSKDKGSILFDELNLFIESYVYKEDFSKGFPEQLQVYKGKWDVIEKDNENLLRVESTNDTSICWLKTYGRDFSFTCKMRCNYDSTAVFLFGIETHPDIKAKPRNIVAGFDGKNWTIEERHGHSSMIPERKDKPQLNKVIGDDNVLTKGKWIDLSFRVETDKAVLAINGVETVLEVKLEKSFFGMPFLKVAGGTFEFDNISFEGEERVMEEFTRINDDNLSTKGYPVFRGPKNRIFYTHDDTLYSVFAFWNISIGKMQYSTDNGFTWSIPVEATTPNTSILELKDGKLLCQNKGGNITISSDEGKNWSMQGKFGDDNRIGGNMPAKLMKTESGRIFFITQDFCAPVPRGEHIEDLGLRMNIHYSDDFGKTWKQAITELNYANTGKNICEISIIELPGGILKLYGRGDGGSLWETTSEDGGVTWDFNLKRTKIVSTLCAFNLQRDPESGYYYIYWNYDNVYEYIPNNLTMEFRGTYLAWRQMPRCRTALAVSRDNTYTWDFIGTMYSEEDASIWGDTFLFNHLMYISDKYIYCSHTDNMTTPVYIMDKSKLKIREMFPGTR